MKFRELRFSGFGPYVTEQRIDFAQLDEAGLFLIAGRTGAGKSTVLDAIVYALYASVPRYDGAAKSVRSTFAQPNDPTSVTLEFEHGDERYRVTRSPEYERPKLRGAGTTKELAAQRFERWLPQRLQWQTVTTKAAEVAGELARIFPLSKDEFLQVALLAQNDFQRFLHADSNDRQKLLRKLFNTNRFDRLRELANERRRAAATEWLTLQSKLAEQARILGLDHGEAAPSEEAAAARVTDEALAELLESATQLVAASQQQRDAAESQTAKAQAAQRELESVLARQQRRHRAAEALAALEADQSRIDREVVTALHTGALAAPLLPLLDVCEEATAARVRAEENLTVVQAAFHTECEAPAGARFELDLHEDPTATELTTAAHELGELLGQLRAASELDDELAAATADAAATAQERERLAAQLAEVRAERSTLPEQHDTLREQFAEAKHEAARVDEATRQLAVERSKLAAAINAEQLDERVAVADTVVRRARQTVAAARAAEHEVFKRRLRSSAALLAQQLVPAAPCPVCGSPEHPAPAASNADTVTDTEVDTAAKRRQDAVDQEQAAAATLAAMQHELAAQQAAAGGADVSGASELVATAEQQLARANDAAQRSAELATRIDALTEQLNSSARHEAELFTQLTAASEAATSAHTRADELRVQHKRLRAEFDTVAERLRAGDRIAEALREVVRARVQFAAATDTANAAAARATAAIVTSSFANAEAVRAAALSADRRAMLESERDAHTSALASARSVLAEPELQQLPTELVDVVPARAATTAAQDALAEADTLLGERRAQFEHTRQAVARARAYLHELGPVRERYEVRRQVAGDLSGGNEQRLNLEAYVLIAYLDDILDAANQRLGEITANRYLLRRSEALASHGKASGLELLISDVYSGRDRSPSSLSGGETFLVSLALALGLADVVAEQAGGLELETLFIDEGFGSLDADTLDVAMRTLDNLRASGRTVGVISHVTSMHERIPTHVEVTLLPDHSSTLAVRDVFG